MDKETAKNIAKMIISQYNNTKSYLCIDMNEKKVIICDGNGNYFDENGPYEQVKRLTEEYGTNEPEDMGIFMTILTRDIINENGKLVDATIDAMTNHILKNYGDIDEPSPDDELDYVELLGKRKLRNKRQEKTSYNKKRTVQIECEYTQENTEYRKEGDYLYFYEDDELNNDEEVFNKIPVSAFESSECINYCGGDGSFTAEYEFEKPEELVDWLRQILNEGLVLLVKIEII